MKTLFQAANYLTKLARFYNLDFIPFCQGATTFSTMTLSITTLSIPTLSITTLSITILSIKDLFATFSINDTLHNSIMLSVMFNLVLC
jgi:hypothetical protein